MEDAHIIHRRKVRLIRITYTNMWIELHHSWQTYLSYYGGPQVICLHALAPLALPNQISLS